VKHADPQVLTIPLVEVSLCYDLAGLKNQIGPTADAARIGCEGLPTGGERGVAGSGSASSTWAPLRIGLFRSLWIAALVSNVGTWMQTVGAQVAAGP
jgi:hypothetical protein